jgi:hypothetical protein
MSTKNNASNEHKDACLKHSDPIPILTNAPFRRRSASISSSSSGSASSPSEIPTPLSGSGNSHRISIPSPGSSPILSYFLAQSPTKPTSAATYPFKHKFGAAPVFEGICFLVLLILNSSQLFTLIGVVEPEQEQEVPVAAHARRASTVVAGRFAQPLNTPLPDTHHERGTGLLRRLSLSSAAFVKVISIPILLFGRTATDHYTQPQNDNQHAPMPPSPPPNTAVSPTPKNLPLPRDTKPRRSATLNVDGGKPRRAPSPMGERILKGHFDSFH